VKIEKHFDATFSHKFPNGDIASVSFGTQYAEDTDGAIKKEDADLIDKNLAKAAYLATQTDIRRATKIDAVIKEILLGIKHAVQSQQNERDAEKVLDE
jgi:hypothetical protein